MGTLHCALENGAYLYVNERQKMRHYRARSAEERRKNAKSDFFTSRGACVNVRYNYSSYAIIPLQISHTTRWTDGGV